MEENVVLNLTRQIEQARKELAEAERLRKAAWSCEGREHFSHYFVCLGYHARFQLWEQARDKLRLLEGKLAELKGAA